MTTEKQKQRAQARNNALFAMRYAAYIRAVGAQPEFQEPADEGSGEEEPGAEPLTMDRTDITMDRSDITLDMTEA